jgi:hypothetical protein
MTAIVNTQTGEIVESLTAMERSALTHAEATIERGLSSFLEVGGALAQVRESRLYREDHGTFEAYCSARWNITDRRARQMIDAAEIVTSLPTGTVVPVTESQAREIADLDPEVAAAVMAEAATAEKVTATGIRAARERIAPRIDHAALADVAVAEFPDLAYYRDEAPDLEHCWRLAEKLREFAGRGELDERLGYLRRSIDLARAKCNGTYVPTPLPVAKTCPTCGQEVN